MLETQISQPHTFFEQSENFSAEPPASGNFVFPEAKTATETPPNSEGKFIALMGGSLVLLFIIMGLGGWMIWKKSSVADKSAQTMKQNEIFSPPPAQNSRTLSYALLVQKMRDGRKFEEPFE